MFFTPSDKGFIEHLTIILTYLQCFVCMLDYFKSALTIKAKLQYQSTIQLTAGWQSLN